MEQHNSKQGRYKLIEVYKKCVRCKKTHSYCIQNPLYRNFWRLLKGTCVTYKIHVLYFVVFDLLAPAGRSITIIIGCFLILATRGSVNINTVWSLIVIMVGFINVKIILKTGKEHVVPTEKAGCVTEQIRTSRRIKSFHLLCRKLCTF